MAKSKIPNPLERRHLIERALSADRARAIAEDYIDADRVFEAIDFLEKADAQDRLAELRNGAIESGDAFLLRTVAAAMDLSPGPDEWRALESAAAAAGKDRYEKDAGRMAERVED